MSLPLGTVASNINELSIRSIIAPNLGSPRINENASPVEYLRAAQSALQAGRTGETAGTVAAALLRRSL
jgi:hypothetical protein